MKLKTFKIWLFLIPVVAIIGVLLFVQKSNNQRELEQQHIRSISSLSKQIQLALPDYLGRVDAMLLREGYITSSIKPLNKQAAQIHALRKGFQPKVRDLRFLDKLDLPSVEVKLDSTMLRIKNQPVQIPPPFESAFRQAVSHNPKFKGPISPNSLLVMDIDIPIRDLFEKLLDNDFIFEKFYLTNSNGTVVYPDESIGNKLFEPNISKDDSIGRSGITFSKIILDENEFHAYANPIYLGPNRLYFVGLYDSDYFQRVGLRINYNLLSALLSILIMLIASIPILGVVKMGRGDNMTQARITQVGISLMIIAVLMGFALSFYKNRPVPSEILQDKINESSQRLKSSLSDQETILKNWIRTGALPDSSTTNELIAVNSENGYVNKIVYFSNQGVPPLPFFFENDTSFINLRERRYIRYFSLQPHSSTFLDSHYSRSTGELETVIATQDTSSPQKGIDAVTFSVKLKESLSEDYRILLIKEDGKVVFKSQKLETSISNLSESISSDKWKEVSSLLRNNRKIKESTSLQVPLYLNGHQYEAIFQRIDSNDYDKALWQVFLVNSNIYHSFSVLSSLEGAIFLAIYFAFFVFTLFSQWATRTGSNAKGFKSFIFEWLVPTEKNQPRLNYLMIGYFIFFIVLVGILKTTLLNPISTLALLTFSSLSISVINLGSAQVGAVSLGEKITTELLVLSGIFVSTFILISVSFPNLFPGLSALAILSILIIYVWARLRPKKEKIPLLRFIKFSKNSLSAYLVFWFFMIGFLPGYLIQSKTQQFESEIWNQSLKPVNEVSDIPTEFEKARRNMMTTLSDPFDSKIQDFIAPNQTILQSAWTGTTIHLSTDPMMYLGLALLILATFRVILWIQNSIFFDLKPEEETFVESGYAPNYICCINSNQIPPADLDTVIIDLKFSTIADDFVPSAKFYRMVNFHCVENPLSLVKAISQIKNSHSRITVYSGALWKNIYNTLKSERDKSIFSELFSDFKFSVIEIEDVVRGPFKNEDEVLARLKRNKGFYTNIWSDLCFEEKLVCNSYAKEGFFNPARRDTMLDLAQKGIIVPKNYSANSNSWVEWRLFSSVFRHYVLADSSEEEMAGFGAYEKKHGNVRTIQTAVISFVLICIALVGIFDQSFFNEAYAYLTGGLGLLGTLYSFLNQGFAGLRDSKKEG